VDLYDNSMFDTIPIGDSDNCPDTSINSVPNLIEERTDTDWVLKWNDRKERSQNIEN
jgi:hypothetical protein